MVDWYANPSGEPRGAILALPTGGGKTYTATYFSCRHALSDGYKVLWLAHTHHLLQQAYQTYEELASGLISSTRLPMTARVVSGHFGHFKVRDIKRTDSILIASLQAIAKANSVEHSCLRDFIESAQGKLFVVFDEAHHSPAPTYRKFLVSLREQCPDLCLLGLTATPTYTDERKRGWLGMLFPQGIVHHVSPEILMAAGVLAKPNFEEARTEIDPEFDDEDFQDWVGTNRDLPENIVRYLAMHRERNEMIVNHYVAGRKRYGKTILFADRWEQCVALCELFERRGVRAGAIFSKVGNLGATPEERNQRSRTDNDEVLQKFKNNELDVLVNIQMATEGTDVPDAQTVFLTRQTTSQILLTQMVGRALRGVKFGGTTDAYIVSFIDNWRQRIIWASFDEFTGGMEEGDSKDRERQVIQLISIELVRQLARQMDAGTAANPLPYTTLLPLGWFRIQIEVGDPETGDVEMPPQLLMVFDDEKLAFDAFIEAARLENLTEFEDVAVRLPDVRERIESWQHTFFAGITERLGTSLANEMFSVVRHLAQNDHMAPSFFPFEMRDEHDLDRIAQSFIDGDAGPKQIHQNLQDEFRRIDRFWNSLYPAFDRFKHHHDGCVNRLMNGPASPARAEERRSAVVTEERLDREPPTHIKEAVLTRDGRKCVRCGSHERLQIDHIQPSYYGGNHDTENLQTLCKSCNLKKREMQIDFRRTESPLPHAPHTSPRVQLPFPHVVDDEELWEEYLEWWVNAFYQCRAVKTVKAESNRNALRIWSILLHAGNNAEWIQPHLVGLAEQIRTCRQSKGAIEGLDQIVVTTDEDDPDTTYSEDMTPVVTTLGDVLASISRVEGFNLRIEKNGRGVRGDQAREICEYPYGRAMNADKTVAAWKRNRFYKVLPMFDSSEFDVIVLGGDNMACAGQRTLRSVRDSYT